MPVRSDATANAPAPAIAPAPSSEIAPAPAPITSSYSEVVELPADRKLPTPF